MTDVFDQDKADLSGMTATNHSLSTVIHKVVVEVNEKGTEAAAYHPFLFFIRHNKTNSTLFLDKFASPQ
ncbi:unnamed protein product [Coregonus sp. 'balchen']|nr:unnamed protein product [Coregonus sp. 'balchen']